MVFTVGGKGRWWREEMMVEGRDDGGGKGRWWREEMMVEGRDDGWISLCPIYFFPTGKASGSHSAP